MKKKLMIGVSALALTIGLTGCGNSSSGNSFKCTANNEYIKGEMTVYYDGNTVNKMEQAMIYDSAEAAKSDYDTYKAMLDQYGADMAGNYTDVKLDGKKIVMSLSGKELKDEYDSLTVDDIKQELKDEGYTCK